MYTVVAGIDENEQRARACARAVADLPGPPEERTVWLLHSFRDNPSGASAPQVRSVREATRVLEETGAEVELAESSGDPATEILETADEVDADLIALAGRQERSPAGKALFGSTTQAVILDADRSVLVAGDAEDESETD
ncbi:MAG: universal stress protein [Haloferacaceae archaeon]